MTFRCREDINILPPQGRNFRQYHEDYLFKVIFDLRNVKVAVNTHPSTNERLELFIMKKMNLLEIIGLVTTTAKYRLVLCSESLNPTREFPTVEAHIDVCIVSYIESQSINFPLKILVTC